MPPLTELAFDPATTITPFSPEAAFGGAVTDIIGSTSLFNPSGVTWFSASLAIYIPFFVGRQTAFTGMFTANAGVASGNFDLGIYSSDGTRLGHTGSTAQSGTTAIQYVAMAITLSAGVYYMTMAADGTTGAYSMGSISSSYFGKVVGAAQQASAFALPATATLATWAQSSVPIFGITKTSGM